MELDDGNWHNVGTILVAIQLWSVVYLVFVIEAFLNSGKTCVIIRSQFSQHLMWIEVTQFCYK